MFSYLFRFISCTLDLNLIVYNGEYFFRRFYYVCASFTVISTDLFLPSTLGVYGESDTLHAVSFVHVLLLLYDEEILCALFLSSGMFDF